MEIPADIYYYDLFRWAVQLPEVNEEEVRLKNLLGRLCHRDLQELGLMAFTNEEKAKMREQGWSRAENIELAARVMDVLRKDEDDKREMTQRASDLYLQVYDKTKHFDYLHRSIQVRNIKKICTTDYFDEVTKRLPQLSPQALHLCLSALQKSYKANLSKLHKMVEQRYEELKSANQIYEARVIVDSLQVIGALTKEEADYHRALMYEAEADYAEAHKKDRTFLMQTHVQYRSAYQQIFRVRSKYPEETTRIKAKMEQANVAFAEMLGVAGVRTEFKPNEAVVQMVDRECEQMQLSTIYEAVSQLLSIPFMTEESVARYMQIARETALLSCMAGVSLSDSKGNVQGTCDAAEGLRVEAHKYMRANHYYAILRYIKTIIDLHVDCSLEKWMEYLDNYRPEWVNTTTVQLFAQGCSFAMEGDMVTAAHILIPALESYLRQWAEHVHGNKRHYENEGRDDVITLDAILNTLQPDFENQEAWFELKSFLTMGVDENFRNRLCHGLMSYRDISIDGMYLFWICLKMYFKDWDGKSEDR